MVIDVSGSMGEPAGGEGGDSKLDLVKKAAVAALGQFKPDDDVGLLDLLDRDQPHGTDRLPGAGADRPDRPAARGDGARRSTTSCRPRGRRCTRSRRPPTTSCVQTFDAQRINAVLLLTDGKNEDERNTDLDGLLRSLRARNEGQAANPVRVFPIAYGQDADLPTLKRIAEATNATVYNAADPKSINKVFLAVVSNF